MSTIDKTRIVLSAIAVALVAVGAGCGDGGVPSSSEVGAPDPLAHVVATTSVLGDLVSNVGGDCVDVQVVIPPGADPHDFEVSARQAADLRDADLVFSFGLGLEGSLDDALESAATDGVPVVAVSEGLQTVPIRGGTDDDAAEPDPHVWQDPTRMVTVAQTIGDALLEHTDCTDSADGAASYQAELGALDAELAEIYGSIPPERRTLVTNHDAFGYLVDRYDLDVVGVVIPGGSTLAEPSSADLADLAETIESTGVPAIFAENSDSTDLADALAAEVGSEVEVVELYSDALGRQGNGPQTYVELMRTNAQRITEALG